MQEMPVKDDGRRLPHQDHQRCNDGTTLTKKSRTPLSASTSMIIAFYSFLFLSLSLSLSSRLSFSWFLIVVYWKNGVRSSKLKPRIRWFNLNSRNVESRDTFSLSNLNLYNLFYDCTRKTLLIKNRDFAVYSSIVKNKEAIQENGRRLATSGWRCGAGNL